MYWEADYKKLKEMAETVKTVNKTRKLSYINIPVSFDIETSSFYEGEEKRACMYVWAVCVNGLYFTGRTWHEFLKLINDLIKIFDIDINHRLVIYVHNLSYEMQFIKHYFTFKKVIALKKREPINALTDKGIEFRCSYLLSGYSLSTLADVYLNGKVKKLVNTVDYSLIRHSTTRLSRTDYQYIYNDVRIVYEYIKMKIEQDGNITKIQNTKTGYVRRVLENNCIGSNVARHIRMSAEQRRYRRLMKRLTISGKEEYDLMLRAYSGGFTHCSCLNKNKAFKAENNKAITSYDFTSSYPTCLIAYSYPISKGKKVEVTPETFRKYLKEYCCIFNVKFKGLRASITYEHYLSKNKCIINGKALYDNGRIIEAEECITSITNIDFEIIEQCYEWEELYIGDFYTYIKGYLPTPFIKTILDLYEKKTMLKGVIGREQEYQSAKENINALY